MVPLGDSYLHRRSRLPVRCPLRRSQSHKAKTISRRPSLSCAPVVVPKPPIDSSSRRLSTTISWVTLIASCPAIQAAATRQVDVARRGPKAATGDGSDDHRGDAAGGEGVGLDDHHRAAARAGATGSGRSPHHSSPRCHHHFSGSNERHPDSLESLIEPQSPAPRRRSRSDAPRRSGRVCSKYAWSASRKRPRLALGSRAARQPRRNPDSIVVFMRQYNQLSPLEVNAASATANVLAGPRVELEIRSACRARRARSRPGPGRGRARGTARRAP